MTTAPAGALGSLARTWTLLGRGQEFQGEARTNLLRILCIGCFYLIELLNYYGLDLGWLHLEPVVDQQFHLTVTALAGVWALVALAALFCLSQRVLPPALKFATTAADILLLTSILIVADGPRSPLVVAYLLILVLSGLRFHLGLVRFSTVGVMAAYLFLLGFAKWFAKNREIMVPRYHELIVLAALGLTGILLGQIVRRAHDLAREYAQSVQAAGSAAADCQAKQP